jgi:hypothetical protein
MISRKERCPCHLASPRRRQRMLPWQVFGLTGSTYSPDFPGRMPSVNFGFRTCSPLRGSSGISPDSLFILPAEEPRNCTTISREDWKCNTTRCEYLARNQSPHLAVNWYLPDTFNSRGEVRSWSLSARVRWFFEQSRLVCKMAVCRSGCPQGAC